MLNRADARQALARQRVSGRRSFFSHGQPILLPAAAEDLLKLGTTHAATNDRAATPPDHRENHVLGKCWYDFFS